jgi:hypothetical protein
MTAPILRLPSQRFAADRSAHAANNRALEAWARELAALMPVFFGRDQDSGNGSTTSTVYADWPGVTGAISITATKRRADTRLFVTVNTCAYSSQVGNRVLQTVSVDGVDKADNGSFFFNEASSHRGFGWTMVLTGIAAGSHTIKLRWRTATAAQGINVDSNDFAFMDVWEVPA